MIDFREIEAALIGGIIVAAGIDPEDGRAVLQECADVRPYDFRYPSHRILWKTLRELDADDMPLDVITISTRLKESGQLDGVGAQPYLAQLLEQMRIRPGQAEPIVRALLRASSCYALARVGEKIREMAREAMEAQGDPRTVILEAQRLVQQATGRTVADDIIGPDRGIEEINRDIELFRARGLVTGIKSGIDSLDDLTTGFQPGVLYLFGARTGDGKSMLALNLIYAALRQSKNVLLFSLEMASREQWWRALERESGASRRDRGEAQVRDAHDIAMGRMTGWTFRVCPTPGLTTPEMEARCRKERSAGRLDMIVVDHIQLIRSSQEQARFNNRVVELRLISEDLRALGQRLAVPIIATCQLNEATEDVGRGAQRRAAPPRIRDIRDSRDIANTSEVIAFLYHQRAGTETAIIERSYMKIAKNRYGPKQTFEVDFEPTIARIGQAEQWRSDRSPLPEGER